MRSPRHLPRTLYPTCMLAALLELLACGRIGFEDISADDDDAPNTPARDAGHDASVATTDASAPMTDASTPLRDAGLQPNDAGPNTMDAMPQPADAQADAGPADAVTPIADAAIGDAGDDAGDEPDTGTDAAVPCAQSVLDYCSALPSLPTAPAIDGVLECGLQLQAIAPREWTSAGSPIPAGHAARVAAAYRPDGVYVYVEVDDATRLPAITGMSSWCGDGVELYVDADGSYAAPPAYDDPGSIQLLAVGPEDSVTPVSRGERYRTAVMVPGVWAPAGFAAFPTASGYALEAFVSAVDLDLPSLALVSGAKVGFDVGINVSVSTDPPPVEETPDCGRRLGQYFMSVVEPGCADATCLPFGNASAFCTPTLQ